MVKRRISVFGATGSIGGNTIDLLKRHRNKFEVLTVSANRNAEKLALVARELDAKNAIICDKEKFCDLRDALSGTAVNILSGEQALIDASSEAVDVTVMAISGTAGLRPSFAATRAGNHLALANKESVVCAGELLMDSAKAHGTKILPVDSEHNAIFQILDGRDVSRLRRITLTASGGPFRAWSREELNKARPQDALAHPVWSMGEKISVDSASLMNKGLELIEAQHLFGLQPEQLNVVVHPQSVIHALAEFEDGSVIAQLAEPDMRVAISSCLNWPERLQSGAKPLDLAQLQSLTFEQPDEKRFPCLRLAREAMKMGGFMPCALNAANEIAVNAFLQNGVSFTAISHFVEDCLSQTIKLNLPLLINSLDEVLEVDANTRKFAVSLLPHYDRSPVRASA